MHMEIQPTFEKVYEAYKMSNDKVTLIDGIPYFKIIEKQKIGKLMLDGRIHPTKIEEMVEFGI